MNIKINLIPDAILKQRHEALLKRYATAALVGWLGLLLIIGLSIWGVRAYNSNKLTSLEEDKEQLDEEVNSETNVAFRKEAKQVQTSLNILSSLFNEQISTVVLLESLTANLAPDVVIDSISIEDQKIVMDAIASSYGSVSSTVAAFEASIEAYEGSSLGYFTGVNLGRVINNADDAELQFDLSAVYTPPQPQEDDEQSQDNINEAENEQIFGGESN